MAGLLHCGQNAQSGNARIVADRDVNVAKNILAAGLAVTACGGTIRPMGSSSAIAGSMKQEPKS